MDSKRFLDLQFSLEFRVLVTVWKFCSNFCCFAGVPENEFPTTCEVHP